MTNCVTQTQKNSREYKAAMDKFNISSGELEMLLHEYQNLPENVELFQAGKLPFPSETYLQEHIYAPASFVSDSSIIDAWEKHFSKPIIVNNRTSAEQIVNLAAKVFDINSIVVRETKDRKYQVLVTKPIKAIKNAFGESKFTQNQLLKVLHQVAQSVVDNAVTDSTIKVVEVRNKNGNYTNFYIRKPNNSGLTDAQFVEEATKYLNEQLKGNKIGAQSDNYVVGTEVKPIYSDGTVVREGVLVHPTNYVVPRSTETSTFVPERKPYFSPMEEMMLNRLEKLYPGIDIRQSVLNGEINLSDPNLETEITNYYGERILPNTVTNERQEKAAAAKINDDVFKQKAKEIFPEREDAFLDFVRKLDQGADNYNAQLLNYLLDNYKKAGVDLSVQYNDDLDDIASITTVNNKAVIEINRPRFLFSMLVEGSMIDKAQRIIVHELIHPLTTEVISMHPALLRVVKARRADIQFAEDIDALYDIATERLDGNWYGLTNKAEFVAELMTNQEFQDALASIPYNDGKQSVWNRFIQILARTLKRVFGVDISNTLLEKALTVTHDYINFTIENGKFGIKNIESANAFGETKKTLDQQFKENQDALRTQLDIIYGIDSEFSAEEFRQIAQDIVYAISDIITEVEKNPEAITKYNPVGKAENISGLSRREILGQIGVDNVLEYLKLNNFDASVNPNIESFEDMDKAEIIVANMDAFLTKGASLFMQLEGFKITKNHTVSDEIDNEIEDLDPNSVADELEEIGGNEQENWGIDKRTEAAFDKASTLVKQALTQCYKLNSDGTPVVSQWGIKQRLDAREATQSILKWTQGALSLSSMVTKLEAQAKKNPWIQPIIDRLKDKSGKDTSFQSQFFGVMSRYFQLYSVGKKQGKKYSVFEVNTHPALTEAKRGISGMYNAGVHPLFDSNGRVNTTALERLKGMWESLKEKKYTPETAQELSETLSNVSALLGYPISAEAVADVLNASSFAKMTSKSLQFIVKSLEDNKDNSSWQPFSGSTEDNGIINNIGKFISPITEKLEDTTNTSFYDSGNMYQSYVTPSYVTKLIQKFSNSTQEDYDRFIQYEYGKYKQFKDDSGWRNSWLELLDTVDGARHILTHKVQLNFDGNRFMLNRSGLKAMSDAELTLSIISEYFKENGYNTKNEIATSWFRIPLMSNKPSSEFIKFYSYRGANYKNRVLNGCMQLFGQEISRIQTVKKRNEQFDADAPERINNLDKRGLKFCFFDFLNSVDNERFHTLVDKVTSNKATAEETSELSTLARDLIRDGIEKEWAVTRESWRNQGIIEAAKSIKGINEESVESALENFFWNDFLAANNILNLTITDISYYKNTEDVQKRLAQLHAPGIRANVEATDFDGNRVADSKTRTVYLKDVEINPETLKSNIIENVKVVFDRKLKEIEGQPQYEATKALYNSIIESFEDGINVADAQGYASPTSYRKKAFVFGKWDEHSEELYQKLVKGEYNFTDLQTAFQPLKPFVYTQIEKDSGVDAASLPTLKVGVQNKNSEYLLIMAGAIIQNEETGMPNYLRAIYDVMEESHKGKTVDGKHIPRVDGIDTIQFESTVKAGLTGVIDITQATTTEEAKQLLEDLIYENKENHLYDKTHVQELEFEDYSIQQEIPAHFRDHEQQQGSQIRMITPSDLNPNMKYKVEGKELSAEEFRKEYENTIAENIRESIQELIDEFHLTPESTPQERNIALARVLQDEILSSPRYGLDLLMSCMLDENGEFIIPLGDSTQSKRIEQLINSIVKNRINKQKIAGGPVVQVSNFGTSRQLNIRFKSKDGSTLETLAEHLAKGGTEESWVTYINKNQAGIAYFEAFVPAYMQDLFRDFMDAEGNIDIEAIEQTAPELLQMIGYRIPTEDKYSCFPIKIVGFLPKEAGDGIMLPYEVTLIAGLDYDIDKLYLMRKEIPIVLRDKSEIRKALKDKFGKDRYDDINIFLDQITDDTQRDVAKASYPDLWKEYVKVAYKAKPYKEGRVYRNNKIIDMTWEVLTHEDTADKLLNPGGFEEQKHEGYLVQAARLTGQPISELEKLTTSELKDKCQSTKNLAFISAHTQYYKQNAAAGSILAIFAVAKVAHACLESNGFTVDVQQVCRIDKPVSIMGLTFFGKMELDPQKDSEGNFIGKTLGSLVASAADAVKDPVLNLMNINSDTVNILNTLVRLGMPFRKAARLLSTQVVSDLLTRYNTEKLSETTTFNRVLDKMLSEISDAHGDLADSQLITEDLTEEEVNNAILSRDTANDYKILLALQRINQINSAMRSLNFATRFNSISSAVGPLIIDNLKIEHNLDNFAPGIFTKEGVEAGFDDVFALHPILKGFSDSVELAKELFGTHMPTNSNQFRNILNLLDNTTLLNTFYRDRSVFSKFSDFYQTYLLTFNNVVSSNPTTVKTYLTEFPAEFAKNDYKGKYAGNPFIEAIRFDTDSNSKNPVLKINITGLDAEAKSKLTSGWLDLYKSGEEGKALAGKLFNYWFYKGGIGYNPTNPISLLPIQLRQRLKGYKDTFEKLPDINVEDVVNQFIRNNWENNAVVPYRKFDKPLQIHDGGYADFYGADAARLNNILAFKTKIGNETVLFIRDEYDINDFGEVRIVYKQAKPLGNNGEFVEITPVSTLNSVLEVPANPIAASESLSDVVPTEITEEEVERTISEEEARNEAQKLADKYLSTEEKVELKTTSSLEDAKSMITEKLKEKGVEVNEKQAEEIAKQFC